MTAHDSFLTLLAARQDLTPQETANLDAHLDGCASCQATAATYAEQDQMIRQLPLTPLAPGIEREILRQAVEKPPARSARIHRVGWRLPGLVGALAALALVEASVIRLGEQTATPANAYDLLRAASQASTSQFPYTGTSEVSYLDLPQYALPNSLASVVGQNRVLVHWAVRDATHFRVDIRTFLPALDSGRDTVVVRGEKVFRYDTRTNTAAVGTLFPFIRKTFAPELLPFLRSGAVYGHTTEPDPGQSIQAYLAQQQRARTKKPGVRPRGWTRCFAWPEGGYRAIRSVDHGLRSPGSQLDLPGRAARLWHGQGVDRPRSSIHPAVP